jgi:DNA invertase Pin-like site-specific DNA recombinase
MGGFYHTSAYKYFHNVYVAVGIVFCNSMDLTGYIRVSTEKQKEDGSHENQRTRLKEWADTHGHQLTLYEDIALSGQVADRDAYDRLLDEAQQYDAIIVRELSRFGRSLQQVLNDIDDLHADGVDFISLKENIDLTTAQGKLFLNIIGSFNQFWADLARERANEMVQRRREAGKPIGRPKKLAGDELEQVYEWREKGLSYGDIATLAGEVFNTEITRQTIYRYCTEESTA